MDTQSLFHPSKTYTPLKVTIQSYVPGVKCREGHFYTCCGLDLELYWEGVLEIIVVGINILREPIILLGGTSLLDERRGVNLRFVRLAFLTLRWKLHFKPPTTSMWTMYLLKNLHFV